MRLKHKLLIFLLLTGVLSFLGKPQVVEAQSPGDCINGYTWVCGAHGLNPNICYADPDQPCGSRPVVGGVRPPSYISEWRFSDGGYSAIGIINFLSMLVRFATILGGIFTMINFAWAGVIYITSAGNTDANTKVKDKLTYSVIGLAIIVSAYTFAGLIGLIFFGNAGFILSPQLQGALTP
jgi:hypothetical protein